MNGLASSPKVITAVNESFCLLSFVSEAACSPNTAYDELVKMTNKWSKKYQARHLAYMQALPLTSSEVHALLPPPPISSTDPSVNVSAMDTTGAEEISDGE